MTIYFKILIGFLMVVYGLSPVDFIPDKLPFLGWFDDLAFLYIVVYYMFKNRLPNFLYRQFWESNPFTRQQANDHHQNQKTSYSSNEHSRTHTTQLKTPYEILGIQPGASFAEIQSAYRKAAQAYHPDKVAHLGEELRKLAEQKFIEIQQAYQELMKSQKNKK
ncbi:MAG: DnaJ domain-containing protein [Desulfobacterales bacterium]|nr:DnaJ domain-containing protein [Desulfobacterales bacterium]